ncbi:D-3-phosphoglycerate dehydrogenase [Candidatus Rhodobacter oscarellae]|uniref:D-3-phosphoglycerate dehydrogenase n=1 Tax=Candidatus Rhodobacter oscarellae TaxID=1675527 RepID=A0A0J9E6J2_9RHOB|nr:2-hydroxyacid dehydrogenase [Candidatus Rhodobacter lobularis]KMW58390.1 D-3-phosphoglycerate dehydrogenase [Candidatus Rhodobacter lobularis]
MTQPVALMIGGADRTAERLAQTFTVHRAGDQEAILAAHGAEIEYLLWQGHGGCDAALMDRMPKLRAISNYGVGYDAIDMDAALARGILVTHTPGVLNDEVANTAVLLLMAVARNFAADERYLRAGRWEAEGSAPLSRSVRGMTVGIVGLGRIGKAAAEKLAVFGIDVVYHGRNPQDVPHRFYPDLVEMARDVDAMISIMPGGAATKHMIGRAVLDALGPEGIFVNIGRGSSVDEPAMIAALQEGRLGWAGLDVFEHEPHVPAALIAMENVTLLPHVGSATVETRNAMGDLAADNLAQFHATGKAITPVPECQ